MGAEGAARIIFRKEIREADDPEKKEKEMIEAYRRAFLNPYRTAEKGYIDEIIVPEETRPKLIKALDSLENKTERMPPKKHANMPL